MRLRSKLSFLLVPVVAFVLMVPADLLAQDHVISTEDLSSSVRDAAKERKQHIATLERFLSSETAQKALRSAGMQPATAQKALPLLSDQELARLSAQVERADFAGAGISLSNEQVTIIIVGIIAIVVVAIIASR